MNPPTFGTRFIPVLRAVVVATGMVFLTMCGDDSGECQKPAQCVTVSGANTCKKIGGHGQCIQSCAAVDGNDSCPVTYKCTGKSDDGTMYCQSAP